MRGEEEHLQVPALLGEGRCPVQGSLQAAAPKMGPLSVHD